MSDKKADYADTDELALKTAAEALRRMPPAAARPEFRAALRESLYANARETLTPLGMRRARRRGSAAGGDARLILIVAGLAAAATIVLAGPTVYDRYQTARLPKLPAAIQEQVGAGGRYSAVKKASYTLNTELPPSPAKLRVYAPKLQPYALSEAEQIARALGFSGQLTDMGIGWRTEDTPVAGSPELGRLLDVDKTEARVTYNDYRAHSGALVSDSQAIAAAKSFLQQAGLPYSADAVSAQLLPDRPQYEVQLTQRLSGYDALGFQSHVWLSRAGGAVVSAYFVRVAYASGLAYPIKTAAQAFDDLKTETVYAEHEQISVRIDSVRLAYYDFPRMNLPTEQTVMQPVYVFTGVDNYGQPFEAMVPAVPVEFRLPG